MEFGAEHCLGLMLNYVLRRLLMTIALLSEQLQNERFQWQGMIIEICADMDLSLISA
jgi:hypothetical protein